MADQTDTHAGHGDGHGEHIHSTTRYHLTFLALIIGTIATVSFWKIQLGAAAFPVAMLIAVTKASCVVLFFMHLWDDRGLNRLFFVSSIFLIFVLIFFVAIDVTRRFPLSVPAPANYPAIVDAPESPEGGEGSPNHYKNPATDHVPAENLRPNEEQGGQNKPR